MKSLAAELISSGKFIWSLSTYFINEAYIDDFLHDNLPLLMLKRYFSRHELIGQHAQIPQINAQIVLLPFEYLGGRIVKGATVGLATALNSGGPAKVTELGDPVIEDDVLRFDVSMCDVHIVEAFNGVSDFPNKAGGLIFGELLLVVHVVEEGAALHVLQNDVDVVLVAHQPIELHDVGVADEGLQLDFLDHLVQHVRFNHFGLHDLLEGAQEAQSGVPELVGGYLAISTSPKRPAPTVLSSTKPHTMLGGSLGSLGYLSFFWLMVLGVLLGGCFPINS
jgi:hypothetical protein